MTHAPHHGRADVYRRAGKLEDVTPAGDTFLLTIPPNRSAGFPSQVRVPVSVAILQTELVNGVEVQFIWIENEYCKLKRIPEMTHYRG